MASERSITLGRNQVHVWQASLTLPDRAWRDLWALLDKNERAQADRYHSERDRQRYSIAHGILRRLLSRYVAVPPTDIRFLVGAHGKPDLAQSSGDRALRFNIAHSGELALFAFAEDREVGVDVEVINSRAADPAIAERFFAPAEWRRIVAQPPADRPLMFARFWTLKEAYLKALGIGLTQPLNGFEISLDGDVPSLVSAMGAEDTKSSWTLSELSVGPQYAAALCVEGTGWELVRRDWE